MRRQVPVRRLLRLEVMPNRLSYTLAALAVLSASPAFAEGRDRDHEAVRSALMRNEILPLSRILAIAAERAPGDVLKIELERDRTALVYEVKILAPNGKVREVKIDAKTGVVLKVEDD
jgi:uncharacterized membrane protein YkoI